MKNPDHRTTEPASAAIGHPAAENASPVDLHIAPEGAIWVCGACGKTSKDRYGDAGSSWDESCMLNAILCHAEKRFTKDGLYCWRGFGAAP